ncbi:hypothetical protein [Corynebacterium cystitidis]|uniref:hypothetical protein n=1 Tax=Corynebacterium cystitidis TaxID=35757 RepID=UPI00211DE0FA|nr:hypothetical protein [Corynebacterium cystitidis]
MSQVTVLPETWIELLGLAVVVGLPILLTNIFGKGAKQTKEDDQSRTKVEAAVTQGMSMKPQVERLQGTVDYLFEELNKLRKQISDMQPVVEVKYPAALEAIGRFQQAHPDSSVIVAPEISSDLNRQ